MCVRARVCVCAHVCEELLLGGLVVLFSFFMCVCACVCVCVYTHLADHVGRMSLGLGGLFEPVFVLAELVVDEEVVVADAGDALLEGEELLGVQLLHGLLEILYQWEFFALWCVCVCVCV